MTPLLGDITRRGQLSDFIARSAGAESAEIFEARVLSGGAIQENWRVDVAINGGPLAGRHALVLRCDAASGVSVSHGRLQEFALLQAAFAAGVAVPEPLWCSDDLTLLGRPFFLMRCVEGTADAQRLTKDPGFALDRALLARRLGEELARLHTIRPPQPALGLPTVDEAPALRLVARARMALDEIDPPHPVLEWALRWLERHAPPRGDVVLCHRDFRTGNYMVGDEGLTGILDWEFAGFSDPMEDLGWFCAKCWRFARPDREAGGVGERADFYAGYEAVSGRAVDDAQVGYWEVMAHVNWAVIALQQAERHTSGQEPSLLLALTGHIVPELEWELLNMTGSD
jgi:aminoglycoside phosphotransferase (APT) family kinase protein